MKVEGKERGDPGFRPKPNMHPPRGGRRNQGSRLHVSLFGRLRRRIIFYSLDIGAIARQNPLANSAGSERGATGTSHMTVLVDGAEAGNGVKFFARGIGIVDRSLEFYLLVAAAPTAPTYFFPQTNARQGWYLLFF